RRPGGVGTHTENNGNIFRRGAETDITVAPTTNRLAVYSDRADFQRICGCVNGNWLCVNIPRNQTKNHQPSAHEWIDNKSPPVERTKFNQGSTACDIRA